MPLLVHTMLGFLAGASPTAAADDPYARALAAFEEGDYEEAATQFERAFEAEGDVALLYDWGQAERLAGHCDVAVDLYDRFVAEGGATTPDPDAIAQDAWAAMRDNAKQQADACREQLDAAAPPETKTTEPPPPRVDPSPADPEARAVPASKQTTPDRSRRPDAVGIGLVVAGSAVAATGIGLLIGADVRQRSAREERVHQDQRDGLEQASQLQIAGFVVLPAGVALAVGGAIRLGLVARRRAAAASIVPTGTGLVVRGRF